MKSECGTRSCRDFLNCGARPLIDLSSFLEFSFNYNHNYKRKYYENPACKSLSSAFCNFPNTVHYGICTKLLKELSFSAAIVCVIIRGDRALKRLVEMGIRYLNTLATTAFKFSKVCTVENMFMY